MCAFSTTTLGSTILDPRKRVRYATGLVLGVDEFQQDQTYLMERDQRHQRALHGYGTVYGLGVRARVRDGEAEVVVEPGLAVDPRGRDICIPAPQCARLDSWLAANADAVAEAAGSFPDALSLYVVLCHQECETDRVPLPGSPCRSEDDAIAPSRIADHFELQLTLEPPIYAEEPAVRRFGRLLRRLHLSDEAPVLSADDLADRVRALATGEGADTGPLHLHPDDAADLIRLAFRVWTVEVRPQLDTEGGCPPPTTDACVLLGQIDLQVVADGDALRVDAAAPAGAEGVPGVEVGQEDRPYLVSTRVLQEWLALLAVPAPGPGPGSFPDEAVLLALNDLIDVEAAPSAGDVLTWDGEAGAWVAAPLPPGGGGGITDHGALSGLDEDDHPQYLLVTGTRPMGGVLDMDGNTITNVPAAGGDGQVVPFEQAVKIGDAAGGDLAGTYPNPTVGRLQGRDVADVDPGDDHVLTWDGSAWTPQPLPAAEPHPTSFEEGLVRIQGFNWAHGINMDTTSLPNVLVQGESEGAAGLVIEFGREAAGDAEVAVGWGSLDLLTFQVIGYLFQSGFYQIVGLTPRSIDPVEVLQRGASWRVRVRPDSGGDGVVNAPAALFRFPREVSEGIPVTGLLLSVVLRGDFVRDSNGRAIDAEHLRAELPSGDRPRAGRVGLQGGRFESWFFVRGSRTGGTALGGLAGGGFIARPPEEPGRETPDLRDVLAGVLRTGPGTDVVNVNTATREELIALPNIGPTLADRIIAARSAEGGLERPDALLDITGLSDRVLDGLRGRIRF